MADVIRQRISNLTQSAETRQKNAHKELKAQGKVLKQSKNDIKVIKADVESANEDLEEMRRNKGFWRRIFTFFINYCCCCCRRKTRKKYRFTSSFTEDTDTDPNDDDDDGDDNDWTKKWDSNEQWRNTMNQSLKRLHEETLEMEKTIKEQEIINRELYSDTSIVTKQLKESRTKMKDLRS